MEISHDLQQHHALFYQCWQLGRPLFTESIPTAAVQFNEQGEFLEFLFNPDYWESKTPYERLFIICHECLHVALNHGIRILNQTCPQATNVTLDVVVNHALVREFGFDREKISNWKDLCWTDTVFKDSPFIPKDESFEFYYNRLPKIDVLKLLQILDDHSKLVNENGSTVGRMIRKLNERLTPEEKETLKKLIQKQNGDSDEGEGDDDEDAEEGIAAGTGMGGWDFINISKVKPKRKWETVIKKWSKKYLSEEGEAEQWARINRRITGTSSLVLPSEMEEGSVNDTKVLVFFFLDTSRSCWNLRERFFTAAASLPKDKFLVRLFCFDTSVQETDLVSRRIYGGGGTCFRIIEQKIQELIANEKIRYPEAIFIITDGYGTTVQPQRPENWYWFLTSQNSTCCIPKESKRFNLKDYE